VRRPVVGGRQRRFLANPSGHLLSRPSGKAAPQAGALVHRAAYKGGGPGEGRGARGASGESLAGSPSPSEIPQRPDGETAQRLGQEARECAQKLAEGGRFELPCALRRGGFQVPDPARTIRHQRTPIPAIPGASGAPVPSTDRWRPMGPDGSGTVLTQRDHRAASRKPERCAASEGPPPAGAPSRGRRGADGAPVAAPTAAGRPQQAKARPFEQSSTVAAVNQVE
jgi:hypothetical protein